MKSYIEGNEADDDDYLQYWGIVMALLVLCHVSQYLPLFYRAEETHDVSFICFITYFFLIIFSLIGASASINRPDMKYFVYRFYCLTSSISWYSLFHLFITSQPGLSLKTLMSFSWFSAFFALTSVAIAATIMTKHRYHFRLTSAIGYFALICMVASNAVVKLMLNNSDIPQNVSNLLFETNELPTRFKELECGNYCSMIYVAVISCIHLLVHAVTQCILPPPSSSQDAHRHQKSDEVDEAAAGDREEGGGGDVCDSSEHRDLPADCIEVTMDEAIAIQNGTLRYRRR